MDILSLAIKRLGLIISLVFFFQVNSFAAITGITGPVFNLTTSSASIPTPDGNSVHMWGYGVSGSTMQYPGQTLIVNQGDLVTVNLTNTNIPMPVSILFPGQSNVVATGGVAGLLTQESSNASTTVTYTFTASNPGTYTYYSGTRPGLQVEMGLIDRKSTRLNSSHRCISYAVFCLKKKTRLQEYARATHLRQKMPNRGSSNPHEQQ